MDCQMNISSVETSLQVEAKTCGCKEKGRTISYSFIDSYHSLCIDKWDIIWNQIRACEKLVKYSDDDDKRIIEHEIGELKTMLDLLS
jgi:hypothetical protein